MAAVCLWLIENKNLQMCVVVSCESVQLFFTHKVKCSKQKIVKCVLLQDCKLV